VTLFSPGQPVLAGVDEVLRVLTTEALKGLATPVGVSVGPLDRPVEGPRLNWFLYRVEPALAYANMESPQHGWRTRRGHPPLALTLHYLLTADAGELTENGTEDDVVHAALSALMSALHDNGIFGIDTPIATAPSRSVSDVATALVGMIEPLRITIEQVPFETITALWNTGSHALRLSLGYQVSLVTVPAQTPFVPGPPVLTRRVGVAPSLVPVISSVLPATAYFDLTVAVQAHGITDLHQVTLGRLPGDPDDPTDGRPDPAHTHSSGPWRLAETPAPNGLTVHLPNGRLVPGARPLVVTNLADGLPAGSGHAMVTVVPVVVSAGAPLTSGASATLTVRHVTADGAVFLAGTSVSYTPVSDTTIQVVVPVLPPDSVGATVAVSLRCGTVAGPPTELAVSA
jgi:Pvc16 N-terminal domain